ncbi:hypothetical protein MTR_0028s0320 [Medicago truncatula]|uniref:Uncharacterized protein n=1 Tax=Medicago truncatula TaxID=3880 RepID=A0A072TI95_MEDTR|nr:hypothetical protein MTR_0028s0320 [Medicago truncatula]
MNIDLYKGDTIYALGSMKILRQRGNYTHMYYHERNPSSLTSVFLASTEVLEEDCSCGLDRGSAICLAVIVIPVRRFHRSFSDQPF